MYGKVCAAREVTESRVARVDEHHVASVWPAEQTRICHPEKRLVGYRGAHPHREEARARVEHWREAHGSRHNGVLCENNRDSMYENNGRIELSVKFVNLFICRSVVLKISGYAGLKLWGQCGQCPHHEPLPPPRN